MKIIISLFLIASVVYAGDGNVSKRSLERMGLGQMKYMTEKEGLSIRGDSPPTYDDILKSIHGLRQCRHHPNGTFGGFVSQRAVVMIQSRGK